MKPGQACWQTDPESRAYGGGMAGSGSSLSQVDIGVAGMGSTPSRSGKGPAIQDRL